MITISLDQSNTGFRPGETIVGTVSWSDLGEHSDKLETRLVWYTEGKGNQDIEVVKSLPSQVTQPDGSARFEFTAPTRPFSFTGKLISLIWVIEVVVFPSREGYREPITLSLDGSEIKLEKSLDEEALKSSVSIG
jgi:hypothetical protein